MLNLHGNQQQICNYWSLNRLTGFIQLSQKRKTTRYPYTGTADKDTVFSILEGNLTVGNSITQVESIFVKILIAYPL